MCEAKNFLQWVIWAVVLSGMVSLLKDAKEIDPFRIWQNVFNPLQFLFDTFAGSALMLGPYSPFKAYVQIKIKFHSVKFKYTLILLTLFIVLLKTSSTLRIYINQIVL